MNHPRNGTISKADLLFQKAFAAHNAGCLSDAEELYKKALKKAPSDMETLYLLGTVCSQQGKLVEANKFLARALEIDPCHPEALNNMGLTLMSLRKREEAVTYYKRALDVRPDYADACSNLGHTLEVLGDLDEAEYHLRHALTLNPNHANVHYNLGLVLLRRDRFEEAANCFVRGLQIQPNLAVAYNDLGSIYKTWGRLAQALACFDQSIALNPNAFYSRNNRGAVLEEMGRLEEALAEYERAIELEPLDPRARWNTAYLYLRQGILDKGWEAHETRTILDHTNDRFPYPLWDGSAIDEKTLLIMAEQGIGDEIFFASCFPDIVAKAKHVVIECEPRLAPLLARSFPSATVKGSNRSNIGWIVDVPKIDTQIAAGSIPKYVRPTLESFPSTPAYLVADPNRVEYWRSRLALLGPGLKVGICWRSGLRVGERLKQYSELSQWGQIFKVPNVRFVKLQYDECSQELCEAEKLFGVSIERFEELDMMNNLDDTSALISSLDLVISAGTAVSEMAGALGTSVFRLDVHGKSMDALGTGESPWHPNMRLFGQIAVGDWETPLALVGAALREKAEGVKHLVEYVTLRCGLDLAVNDNLEDMSTYVLNEQGGWFDSAYDFWINLVKPDSRVLDIGAGVGAYVIPQAGRLIDGRMWAYTESALETELLVNSRVRNCMEGRLNVAILDSGFSIDEEMNKHGYHDIGYVRLSVSTCEPDVLEGGARFFSSNTPLIMLGVRQERGIDSSVIAWLKSRHYQLYRLIPGLQLLVPLASVDELDVFDQYLFACKADRAGMLKAEGVLLDNIPALKHMPGVEVPLWQAFIATAPYAADKIGLWQTMSHKPADWEVYWMALNLYAMSQSSQSSEERYASLLTASGILGTLIREKATLPRLLTFCRILIDLGRRQSAVALLNQVCQLLAGFTPASLEEPCLVLEKSFGDANVAGNVSQWVTAMVLLKREDLRAFSDFFTHQEALPVLREVSALGFGNATIERRIALITKRFNVSA